MSAGVVERATSPCSSTREVDETETNDCTRADDATTGPAVTPVYPRWHSAVAGATAGAAARLVTAPLDLLRIRRQLSPPKPNGEYMWTSLIRIAKSEGGIHSLFRGNVAATYLWMGYSAVQFSLYTSTRSFLTVTARKSTTNKSTQRVPASIALAIHTVGSNATAVSFVSGATAGLWATILTYPFDICRTIFAAQGRRTISGGSFHPPRTMGEFAIDMYRKQGARGFFAGSAASVIQIVPYMGLNFAIHDELLKRSEQSGFGSSGLAGVVSGGVSKLVIYPLDTVKKRLQAQAAFLSGTNYKGTWDCLVTMARQEGARSLYNGLAPSLVKNMLGTGISFACFTLTNDMLESLHDQ